MRLLSLALLLMSATARAADIPEDEDPAVLAKRAISDGSVLLARRPYDGPFIRPKHAGLGLEVAGIKVPKTSGNSTIQRVVEKVPLLPMPLISADISNGSSHYNYSLMYFSFNDVDHASMKYVTLRFGRDAFLFQGSRVVTSLRFSYTSASAERERVINEQYLIDYYEMRHFGGQFTIGRQSTGGTFNPYIGGGGGRIRTQYESPYAFVYADETLNLYYSVIGFSSCYGNGTLCLGIEAHDDNILPAYGVGYISIKP